MRVSQRAPVNASAVMPYPTQRCPAALPCVNRPIDHQCELLVRSHAIASSSSMSYSIPPHWARKIPAFCVKPCRHNNLGSAAAILLMLARFTADRTATREDLVRRATSKNSSDRLDNATRASEQLREMRAGAEQQTTANPIQSNPIQSNPIQSNPIQSPISNHSIPFMTIIQSIAFLSRASISFVVVELYRGVCVCVCVWEIGQCIVT